MKNEIIAIKDLTFGYENHIVLEDLNLSIEKGDFIAITGANGSGKSTLLKLILNELKANKGEIIIQGEKVEKYNNWINIGYVPQITGGSIPTFPISALEIVSLNLYSKKFFRKKNIEISRAALDLVGMKEFENVPINKMSGGQQQRIMIAKALVNSPDIMILDEPLTGIDKESRAKLFEILNHFNKKHNITIIVVTHDLKALEEGINKVVEILDKKAVVV